MHHQRRLKGGPRGAYRGDPTLNLEENVIQEGGKERRWLGIDLSGTYLPDSRRNHAPPRHPQEYHRGVLTPISPAGQSANSLWGGSGLASVRLNWGQERRVCCTGTDQSHLPNTGRRGNSLQAGPPEALQSLPQDLHTGLYAYSRDRPWGSWVRTKAAPQGTVIGRKSIAFILVRRRLPPPIRAHERRTPVVGVETGAHFDLYPIIQSPLSFRNLARHATADGTPHPPPLPRLRGRKPWPNFGPDPLHTLIKRGGPLENVSDPLGTPPGISRAPPRWEGPVTTPGGHQPQNLRRRSKFGPLRVVIRDHCTTTPQGVTPGQIYY